MATQKEIKKEIAATENIMKTVEDMHKHLMPPTKTAKKIWLYDYTFSIRFVGQMPKSQFVRDVSDLTCDPKSYIKVRTKETNNVQDVVAAEKKLGHVIRIQST